MSESNLSVNRAELLREVGRFLGWNRDPAQWSVNQTTDGNDIVNKGLRQFYQPPLLPNERTSHDWSFLKPIGRITTVPGVWKYQLPDDFIGVDGSLTFESDESSARVIEVTHDARIRRLRQWESNDAGTTGTPYLASPFPLASDGTDGQRWEMWFYPTPDEVYEIAFRYHSSPMQITSSKPYPLGGQPHSETLIESCLAAAELKMEDQKGVHWEEFMQRLMASVAHDRRATGPHSLGYNGDRASVPIFKHDRSRHVTYNGVRYD